MGAQTFIITGKGKTAEEAFDAAVERAEYIYGRRGYTGTIAEKDQYVMIELPKEADPDAYAQELIDQEDERINDKLGAAGCFDLGNGEFMFFGWASS